MRYEEHAGALIVYFTEAKIDDESTVQQIGDELLKLADLASETNKMVLDLAAVQFMSSAMIGKLVTLHKWAKGQQIALSMRNINPSILEILKITRLDRSFSIENREEDDPETEAEA